MSGETCATCSLWMRDQLELDADARLPPMAYLVKRGLHLPTPHELHGIGTASLAQDVRKDVERRRKTSKGDPR